LGPGGEPGMNEGETSEGCISFGYRQAILFDR
jgi:hypothetical protein